MGEHETWHIKLWETKTRRQEIDDYRLTHGEMKWLQKEGYKCLWLCSCEKTMACKRKGGWFEVCKVGISGYRST